MKDLNYRFIKWSLLSFTLLVLGACEEDNFDGLTDSKVEDVFITFPEADNNANPAYKFEGVATTPVENVLVTVAVSTTSGKSPVAAWVDTQYNGCLGFANFSFSSVVDTGSEILKGEDAIDFWVASGGSLSDRIETNGASQFNYDFVVDEFSLFWIGAPDQVATGGCAAEQHRIRFVVLFDDGSVDVSQELLLYFAS